MKLQELENRLSTVSDEKLKDLLVRAERQGPEVAVKFILAEAGKRGLWDLVNPVEQPSKSTEEVKSTEEPDQAAISIGTENIRDHQESSDSGADNRMVAAFVDEDPEIYAEATQEFRPIFTEGEISALEALEPPEKISAPDETHAVKEQKVLPPSETRAYDQSAKWLAEEASREPMVLFKAIIFLVTLGGLLRVIFKLLARGR